MNHEANNSHHFTLSNDKNKLIDNNQIAQSERIVSTAAGGGVIVGQGQQQQIRKTYQIASSVLSTDQKRDKSNKENGLETNNVNVSNLDSFLSYGRGDNSKHQKKRTVEELKPTCTAAGNSNYKRVKTNQANLYKNQGENGGNTDTNSDSSVNAHSLYNQKAQKTKQTDFFKQATTVCLGDASPVFGVQKQKNLTPREHTKLRFSSDLTFRHNGENSGGESIALQTMQTSRYIGAQQVNNIYLNENHREHVDSLYSKMDILEKENREKALEIGNLEDDLKNISSNQKSYKEKVMSQCSKLVLDVERYQRQERKSYVTQQKNRVGENFTVREGTKSRECWMDGWEMKRVKDRLEEIKNEKEELEKHKKGLKLRKSDRNGLTIPKNLSNDVIFGIGQDNSDHSNSQYFSEKGIIEAKDRISAQLMTLSREEANYRDTLEKLENEKVTYMQEAKRLYEEQHSRFGKPNPDHGSPAWQILENRYQLLSLLGKGGFSEVYKAYDLDELRYVACKIHQLNPNWNETSKSNYIKHALRENSVIFL